MDFDNKLEVITPTKSTSLTISGTGALFIPAGTVGERPVAPQSGYIRFNTTDTVLEYYNGVAVQWQTFGSATLNSLLSVSGTGVLTQTSPGVYAARTIAAGTAISVTNGDGVAGNPTITNTGVTSIVAGTNITISGATGAVTINASGGGGGGTVTSVSGSGGTTGLTLTGGPITTTGTLTLGGTLIAVNGGTGLNTYAVGDILTANTTTTLSRVADVATGNALISGGVGVVPSWGKIGLTTHVSGTLGVANGGTNLSTTPTNGQLLIGNGTGYTLAGITAGTGISVTNGAGSITIANTGVTSVALALPSIFTVSGSPVTTTGTLTGTLNTQANNTVFAGPVTGGPLAPTFRTLSLDELNDVTSAGATTGQYLLYDGTTWVPYGGAGTGGGLRTWSGGITSTSGTSIITPAVAPPLSTAGTLLATQTLTPLSTSSRFTIQIGLSVSASTNNNVHTCSVFRGTTYIGGAIQTFSSGGNSNAISICLTDAPATVASITYTIRYGTDANTWYVNRRVAENTYGGVRSGFEIQEY